jgi:acyl CoA:acetate/3-ketoacid CoA transferase alpha subunit
VFSNNAGLEDAGAGPLLAAGRLRRIVASYVGENSVSTQMAMWNGGVWIRGSGAICKWFR